MNNFTSICIMNNIIGNILRERLSEKGAPSKRDFAELLGVSPKTLYNILDGSSNLTMDQVLRAGKILKYDIIADFNFRSKSGQKDLMQQSSVFDTIETDNTPTLDEPVIDYKKGKLTTITLNFTIPSTSIQYLSSFMNDITEVSKKYNINIL